MLANPKASKRPAFSALYHVRTQGISFDVPIDLVKILIRFDGKRFETALIDMTVAHHIVVLLPASYMRHGQTLHETPEVSVIFWPHHKMPVIGHHAPRQNPHRQTGDALALAYDEGRELHDQAIDRATRLSIDRQSILLANPATDLRTALRLMSVRAYPPRFALWNAASLIGDLYQATLQYPCPFLLTLGVHVLDAEATRNWAFLKAARATTNATSYMARFLPDLQERKADWDIVLKAIDAGQQLVDLNLQLALFTEPQAATHAEQAARAIFRARGFELSRAQRIADRPLQASP